MNIKDKIITIHIDIADRRAVYREAPARLVCGNPFKVIFSFDEEWEEFKNIPKIAKIKFWHKGRYEHIPIEFTGNECSVPALFGVKSLEIGVFVENDISTTTGAVIDCEKSIRCGESIGVLGADAIDNINKALKGEDGETPYIGENGNWWIGDTDTGAFADFKMTQSTGTDTSAVMSQDAVTRELGEKADADSLYKLSRRVDVLESAAIGSIIEYTEEQEISYRSAVPDNALPFAAIKSVGGMSYRAKNILPFPYTNAKVGTTKVGDCLYRTVNDSGEISFTGNHSSDQTSWLTLNADAFVPTVGTYTLSGCPAGGSDSTYFMRVVITRSGKTIKYIDYGDGVTFEVTGDDTALAISFVIKANQEVTDVVRPQLEYGSTKSFWLSPVFKNELLHAGVAKVNSYDAIGRLVDSIDIPEEVQKLDGYSYGVCNSYNTYDKYNEVDFISGKFTKRCSFSTVKSTGSFRNNNITHPQDDDNRVIVDYACRGSEYTSRTDNFVSSAFNNFVKVPSNVYNLVYAFGTATVGYDDLNCVAPTGRLSRDVKVYIQELEAAGKTADFVYTLRKDKISATDIEPIELLIEVVPGGYLEFVNEHSLAVPHTMLYQTKIGGSSV